MVFILSCSSRLESSKVRFRAGNAVSPIFIYTVNTQSDTPHREYTVALKHRLKHNSHD